MSDNRLLAADIIDVLRRYYVGTHWQASADQKKRVYSVWMRRTNMKSEQVTEPTTHLLAQQCREGLLVADLLELIEDRAQ